MSGEGESKRRRAWQLAFCAMSDDGGEAVFHMAEETSTCTYIHVSEHPILEVNIAQLTILTISAR